MHDTFDYIQSLKSAIILYTTQAHIVFMVKTARYIYQIS